MKKYNPLVSIIVPVYNGANYMREAIDSAISQTYKNIEIIVVNDGSTDNGETERIALSYGDKIKYFYKENGGCASALNYGISKMQGEWFSWLSHDDVYLPRKIESAIEEIQKNNLDVNSTILSCGGIVINDKGERIPSKKASNEARLYSGNDMFTSFMAANSLNGCALLIPKAVLDRAGGFSTKYVYILDWIYWIELSLLGYKFYRYPEMLVKNRCHKGQVSVKKRELLNIETINYILELIDKTSDDEFKQKQIYLYCKRIRLKEGLIKIKQNVKIPLSIKLKGDLRAFKGKLHRFLVKIKKYR